MHQSEERLLVILPIVPRERITCSTCHNPHQTGVIQREAAAKGADTKGQTASFLDLFRMPYNIVPPVLSKTGCF
jgi:hypothetical protein